MKKPVKIDVVVVGWTAGLLWADVVESSSELTWIWLDEHLVDYR